METTHPHRAGLVVLGVLALFFGVMAVVPPFAPEKIRAVHLRSVNGAAPVFVSTSSVVAGSTTPSRR